MNRSAAYIVFALLFGGAVVFGPTLADDTHQSESGKKLGEAEFAKQLRSMIVAQIAAKQKEDLKGTVENIDEPLVARYSKGFQQVFRLYDIKFSLDDFKLLYFDDEVAVTRVKQTLRKIEGPEFKDNQRIALQIFRIRDGVWKIHEQVMLDHILLDTEGKPLPAAAPAEPLKSLQTEKPDTKPGEEE